MLQWIAIVTMLIDHIGYVWFPEEPLYRIIGRMAFPIYAFYVTVGMSRTRSLNQYMLRLGILALLSQLPYALLFGERSINVIGTFFVSVFALSRAEQSQRGYEKSFWLISAGLLLQLLEFDYGAYGLCLMAIYRYTRSWSMVGYHLALNMAAWFLLGWWIILWSIIPTVIIAFVAERRDGARPVPSWLWRSFYPAHLAALALMKYT
ncbi:TraX family protein [Paenibacillus turpanensis]|uniref:TraX family protein n=1 Tax=Paenibacillus turpanensis TaxID=2689078 RepID=UPI00140913DA|nr:TraX family protein [Paenibacillus turpanensis]